MKRWSGVIAIEGIETRDGRIIDEFVWDPGLLPMNFSCQFLRAEGHDGADVTSANMTEITRVGNQILASGYYMDTPAGNMAAMLLGAGTLTAVSVTGGKVEDYRWELLDQNGNLGMSGNLENRLLVYGALELAKEAMSHNAMKQSQNLVQPATMMPPTNLLAQ